MQPRSKRGLDVSVGYNTDEDNIIIIYILYRSMHTHTLAIFAQPSLVFDLMTRRDLVH